MVERAGDRIRRISSVFFALTVACVAGCARVPRFSPGGMLQDAVESGALCTAFQARVSDSGAFRALLDSSLATSDESYSFRYALVGRGSKDLRIDLLPREGAYTLGLLTVRGDKALMIDSQAKRYASECEPNALFERFFGLQGITPDLVRALLLGRIPALACEDVTVFRTDTGRLQFLDLRTHRVWEVDEPLGLVRGVQILNSSHSNVYAVAERVRTPGGDAIAISIFKPVKASAEMQITKLILNPSLAEGLFGVMPPAGYERESCD
jgi:hypothetical protein